MSHVEALPSRTPAICRVGPCRSPPQFCAQATSELAVELVVRWPVVTPSGICSLCLRPCLSLKQGIYHRHEEDGPRSAPRSCLGPRCMPEPSVYDQLHPCSGVRWMSALVTRRRPNKLYVRTLPPPERRGHKPTPPRTGRQRGEAAYLVVVLDCLLARLPTAQHCSSQVGRAWPAGRLRYENIHHKQIDTSL